MSAVYSFTESMLEDGVQDAVILVDSKDCCWVNWYSSHSKRPAFVLVKKSHGAFKVIGTSNSKYEALVKVDLEEKEKMVPVLDKEWLDKHKWWWYEAAKDTAVECDFRAQLHL